MARSYLLPEHEEWLRENYCSMSNEDIVRDLSKMVRKSNEEKIESLRTILHDVTQKSVRKSIEKEIAWREAFKGFDTDYIKKVANRLKCKSKLKAIRSNAGVERARATNIIRWKKKAQAVPHPYSWLRTFRCNECRTVIVTSASELNAVRNAIKNFNKYDSEIIGFHFSTEHIKEAEILKVKAKTNDKKNKEDGTRQ